MCHYQATLRKCSGKVIPQGFLTQKVINGHFKFIPQTGPCVITKPLSGNALEKSFRRGF